ncbi:MAG: hypothetical protein KF819_25585 [Labilithrix sp.]|nr:hypothetical protein [Labilithrix sp.]
MAEALRIDRALFASLTFGMAGLACNTGRSAPVVSVVEIPVQPPQPDAATPPVSAEKIEDVEGHVSPDDPLDEEDIGSSALEGGDAAWAPCGFVDPSTVTRPTSTCNDDQGTARACAMKSCSSSRFPFPMQKCEAYRRFLKPKVADKAIDCLAKLTSQQVCDACNTYRCGDLAMKTACPDPSADATCARITAACRSVSMTDCKTYLAGLNAAGRAKMQSCLSATSGCGFGIYSCAESLY